MVCLSFELTGFCYAFDVIILSDCLFVYLSHYLSVVYLFDSVVSLSVSLSVSISLILSLNEGLVLSITFPKDSKSFLFQNEKLGLVHFSFATKVKKESFSLLSTIVPV